VATQFYSTVNTEINDGVAHSLVVVLLHACDFLMLIFTHLFM